jgi:hypothetical protein
MTSVTNTTIEVKSIRCQYKGISSFTGTNMVALISTGNDVQAKKSTLIRQLSNQDKKIHSPQND